MWECVTKIWSIRVRSGTDRSPTPVPASIRTSSSTSIDVVLRSPPIPPLQPSILSFILFRLEGEGAVPVFGRGIHAQKSDPLEERVVDPRFGRERLQTEQAQLGRFPFLSPVEL